MRLVDAIGINVGYKSELLATSDGCGFLAALYCVSLFGEFVPAGYTALFVPLVGRAVGVGVD